MSAIDQTKDVFFYRSRDGRSKLLRAEHKGRASVMFRQAGFAGARSNTVANVTTALSEFELEEHEARCDSMAGAMQIPKHILFGSKNPTETESDELAMYMKTMATYEPRATAPLFLPSLIVAAISAICGFVAGVAWVLAK